jgi:NAD(P)-dependent dehydrogenase (short-subunit alcohol dehydrogenase family)
MQRKAKPSHIKSTVALVKKQRDLQDEVAKADKKKAANDDSKAQTGARKQPVSPFPAQHQRKPGLESELHPAPRFLAPDYKGSEKLKDKVAIITGGDSGIGRAVAVLFAREGANVAIVYLDEEESDARDTKRHVEKEGGECLLIAGDVRNFDFCVSAIDKTVEKFGKLDILVNNAAFQLHTKDIADLSEEHFDLTMKTNVYGYFHMAKAAIPHLTEGSAIINTGSETAIFGTEELLDYSTTKGAIHAFTRSLAGNLLPKGIRVNAVAPGPVWTPLNPSDRTAKDVRKFGSKTGWKRPAQPEEISPAYVYLAAPVCSSFVTGIVLPILGQPASGG